MRATSTSGDASVAECSHPNLKSTPPEWLPYSGEFVLRIECPDCPLSFEADLTDEVQRHA